MLTQFQNMKATLVLAFLVIAACSDTGLNTNDTITAAATINPSGAFFSVAAADFANERNELELQAQKIEPGMSRQEVAALIGPHTFSLTPERLLPLCDSHEYIKNGEQRFIWVNYEAGVESVIINAAVRCYIE